MPSPCWTVKYHAGLVGTMLDW